MAQYATISDLTSIGLPSTALGQLTTAQQNAALEEASRELDSRVAGRYGIGSLPFLTWDTLITGITCRIAAYRLLSVRGYSPAAGADTNIKARFDAAIRDCELIQKQQLHPVVTVTTAPEMDQPVIISSSVVNLSTGAASTNRGW